MLPHLPLSPIWKQETLAVQQGETSLAKSRSVKELWPNATPIEQGSTVLSSYFILNQPVDTNHYDYSAAAVNAK